MYTFNERERKRACAHEREKRDRYLEWIDRGVRREGERIQRHASALIHLHTHTHTHAHTPTFVVDRQPKPTHIV
jgi:hypothetical protein